MYTSEFCDVQYNENLNIVLVTWKKFCRQDDYRSPLRYALKIMKTHEGCCYVADTRSGFENEQEDTNWLFEVFLPEAASTNAKTLFFIIDEDNSLKKELEGQVSELEQFFDVIYCFSLDEVAAWITYAQKAKTTI
ncbi:MAG: hypothetical protein FWG00_06405 [Coriobacteriia bacterium]|jgi:hypothetical protein|nr:hypothetical protein [Coriobacteriia bacterium]